MDTNYGEREIEIVKAGIYKIQEVLFGNDTKAKERLLFYLDWYLDSYYKNDLSKIENNISSVLQNVVIRSDEDEVVDEAIHLLSAYLTGPFNVIKEHLSTIPQKFRPDVLDLIMQDIKA